MPILTMDELTPFFRKVMYKDNEFLEASRELNVYSRSPASTWISKIWHSGGLESSLPISLYVFLKSATNSKNGVVVFRTSRKWVVKYSSASSPGNAYLNDISSLGKSFYFTTTIDEFYLWSISDPTVPIEIKKLAFIFKQKDVELSSPKDLIMIGLGEFFQKTEGILGEKFDLNFLAKFKKTNKINLRNTTNPKKTLENTIQKFLKETDLAKELDTFTNEIKSPFTNKISKYSISVQQKAESIAKGFAKGSKGSFNIKQVRTTAKKQTKSQFKKMKKGF